MLILTEKGVGWLQVLKDISSTPVGDIFIFEVGGLVVQSLVVVTLIT
jgi:hypothetical protein